MKSGYNIYQNLTHCVEQFIGNVELPEHTDLSTLLVTNRVGRALEYQICRPNNTSSRFLRREVSVEKGTEVWSGVCVDYREDSPHFITVLDGENVTTIYSPDLISFAQETNLSITTRGYRVILPAGVEGLVSYISKDIYWECQGTLHLTGREGKMNILARLTNATGRNIVEEVKLFTGKFGDHNQTFAPRSLVIEGTNLGTQDVEETAGFEIGTITLADSNVIHLDCRDLTVGKFYSYKLQNKKRENRFNVVEYGYWGDAGAYLPCADLSVYINGIFVSRCTLQETPQGRPFTVILGISNSVAVHEEVSYVVKNNNLISTHTCTITNFLHQEILVEILYPVEDGVEIIKAHPTTSITTQRGTVWKHPVAALGSKVVTYTVETTKLK